MFQKGRVYQIRFIAGLLSVQKVAGVVISKYYIFSIPKHILHLWKVWDKAGELGKNISKRVVWRRQEHMLHIRYSSTDSSSLCSTC